VRAVTIVSDAGPPDAIAIGDIPAPTTVAAGIRASGEPVRIEVHAASVAFPELLQSRGRYHDQPAPPFVPGAEVAGLVAEAPPGTGLRRGDRVFAHCQIGGLAEEAMVPSMLTFRLPERLDFAAGAAIFSNYHSAYFCVALRGRAREGEWVVVHGAAGGLGTATLQVAKGLGLRTIGIVSSPEKAEVARAASADHVVRSDGPWKDEVVELTGGGADLVVEIVGTRALDSLRALRECGRLVIAGFAGGEIPAVKTNRLLLRNVDVVGAGYGPYAYPRPELSVEIGAELERLIEAGFVRPIIGARFPLERAADAFALLDDRRAVGKVVVEIP
jgi:NADPH2:quinone reductase